MAVWIKNTPFDILEAVDIIFQIGEGMLNVHELRIVHQDLKLDNILVQCLTDLDLKIELVTSIKVIDFGLSIEENEGYTFQLDARCGYYMLNGSTSDKILK